MYGTAQLQGNTWASRACVSHASFTKVCIAAAWVATHTDKYALLPL